MFPRGKARLFGCQNETKKGNPQQAATFQLLQISDEDYQYESIEENDIAGSHFPTLQKHRSSPQTNSKMVKNQRQFNSKPLIFGYLAKTQNNLQKQSKRYISGEEVCVMKKQKVVNLSNFLVLDSQYDPPVFTTIPKQELDEEYRINFRAKPSKNIVAFIRRRNLSYLKQQFNLQIQEKRKQDVQKKQKSPSRVLSPRKVYGSCQLRKPRQESSQPKHNMKIFERPINVIPQMNCTSPSFRNKKISNYIKYRFGAHKPENLY